MRYLRTNTATRVSVGPFFDKTDGITPEVALTVTSCKLTLMVDTANVPTIILDTAPTASGGANDMVHVTGDDAGFYDLELAAANVNYLGRAMLAITDAATHCPVFHEFMILPANVYDSFVLGTDYLDANAAEVAGATPETAASTADAVWDEARAGHVSAGTFGANVIADVTLWKGSTAPAMTGDAFARIGAAGAGLTAVPWNASWDAEVQSEVADELNAIMADSIPADGTRPSIAQGVYMLIQFMTERSVSSTTCTVKKVDGSTSLFTLTLDSGTAPTSITRAT